MELGDLINGNCYHICTDGQGTPVVMKDKEDFRTACVYLALLSWKFKIDILAYIVMSNHVHILTICKDRREAQKFIKAYKQKIALYLRNKYGTEKSLRGIADSITLVDSLKYLQNCIAYILRNALCAKACIRLEEYPWSSYSAYFAKEDLSGLRKISSLGARERKKLLKSRDDISDCPYYIDTEGNIVNKSFIKADIVEAAFRNSSRTFLYSLGTCNDIKMEYELAFKPLINVNDIELLNIAEQLATSKFAGKTISELTNANKCAMIKTLYFNNKTTIPQLSRILGLPRDLVANAINY